MARKVARTSRSSKRASRQPDSPTTRASASSPTTRELRLRAKVEAAADALSAGGEDPQVAKAQALEIYGLPTKSPTRPTPRTPRRRIPTPPVLPTDVRAAVLHLLDVAACHGEKGQEPDAQADSLLRQVVDLLSAHQRRRDKDAHRAHVVKLAEELQAMYERYKRSAAATAVDLRQEIAEFFNGILHMEISDEALAALAVSRAEISAYGGSADAAKRGVALALGLGEGARAIKKWNAANVEVIPPTAYGLRTSTEDLVTYFLSGLEPYKGDRRRSATEIRLRRLLSLHETLMATDYRVLRAEWIAWKKGTSS